MIRFFAAHPTAANLLMAVLCAIGLIAIPGLKRESMPDVAPVELEIRVIYPGASAEDVEETICMRIEDALDGTRGLKEMRSESREGLGKVIVEMVPGADFGSFKDDVDTAVAGIDDFPDDAEAPVVEQRNTDDLVLQVLVSGPMPAADLKAYCEGFKERLQRLSEVTIVEVEGFADRQFRAELDAALLRRYELTAADVADLVARQSVDRPAGSIEARDGDVLLRVVEQRRTPSELEALVLISEDDGAEVRLGDLGRIVDLFEDGWDKAEIDGKRAGVVAVRKPKSQDAIVVAEAAKAFVTAERKRMPPSMKYVVTRDVSRSIGDQIGLIVENGWQGMILVFLTMWLFFNGKLAFWVVMSLPVSILGALFLMPLFGLTVNFMTLIGFLLALGILMDDGIVIAENIARHRQEGRSALNAVVAGVSEVRIGVVASFLTTVCILGPLTAIGGDVGRTLRSVPIILLLVLAVSLIEAFLILPAHLSHSVGNTRPPGRLRRWFDAGLDWVREIALGRSVDFLLRWRYLAFGTVVAVFLLSIGMLTSGRLPFVAMPPLEGNIMVARVLFSQGTPLARTETAVTRLEAALARTNKKHGPAQPGGKLVERHYVRYGENSEAFESGPHVASIYVDLLPAEERVGRMEEFLRTWRDETGDVPGAVSMQIAEPKAGGPAGKAIEVRLQDDDLGRLKRVSAELEVWYAEYAGVSNLLDDLRPGKPEERLRLREGAFRLGLSAADIARQVGAAYQGTKAADLQRGRESFEIQTRLHPSDRDSPGDIDSFMVALPDGSWTPLDAVVVREPGRGWARIARVDGRRTVTLRGDVDSARNNTSALHAKMQRDFLPGLKQRHPSVGFSLEGEVQGSRESGQSMVLSMAIGLVGVFLLLSFQFRSYVEPIVVMLAIPFALIGVVWGHIALGLPFTLPSLLGFIALAGVVVNDSILLVEFLKEKRRQGVAVEKAAALASRMRFRAVILTSATTVAGLLPLLAERSLSAQIIQPLAVSTAFGLMASTVLVLLVLPVLYTILADLGLTERKAHADEGHPEKKQTDGDTSA